jgi:hypothetical protein
MVRIAHAKTTPVIEQADWNADHVIEGLVADNDPRLSDARPPIEHGHDYASSGHGHDLSHDHDAQYAPVHAHDYASTGHGHDATHDHNGTYAPVHSHDYASSSHTHDTSHSHDLSAYATTQDLSDHEASPHGGAGGELYAVGDIYITTRTGDPATLLGYGTWQAFGAGRVLVGLDAGDTDFDTTEETGGAKTHTLTTDEMPSHTHVETNNSSTSGPNVGFAARDTSTNNQTATGYSTEPAGGGGAHNNLQPFVVVHMWKRTA